MKKQLLVLFCAVMFSATMFGQAKRTTVVEEFTNASCGPCASQNPILKKVLDTNYPKVLSIKYQTNFPGFDPFNTQNPAEVQSRWSYYAVFTGVPSAAIDGYAPNGAYQGSTFAYVGQPASIKQPVLDYHLGLTTPLSVKVSHSMNAKFDSITVRMVVKNVDTKSVDIADLVGHIAIVEKNVVFANAPGNNGEKEFYGVMRKMLPNASGTKLPATMAVGDSTVINIKAAFPGYIYSLAEVGVVGFVQQVSTKAIFNAAASEPVALPADLVDAALEGKTDAPKSLCTYDLTPSVKVTNNGATTDITEFTASYTINKGTAVTKKWTGILKPADVVTVTFPSVVVKPGETNVDYTIDKFNGGVVDYNKLNNTVATYNFETIPALPTQDSLFEDFQVAAIGAQEAGTVMVNPKNSPVYVVKKAISTNAKASLGGFGKSDGSMRWTYWAMEPGDNTTLIFYKANLKNRKNLKLTFAHAFAQYSDASGTTNDSLQVFVSKDCGNNWVPVFEKSGDDLKTTTPVSTAAFYPSATQWKANTIDLAKYDGASELTFAFKGSCDFGNNMYVDDILVTGQSTIIGTNDATFEGNVSMYPNPVADLLSVNVTLTEATTLNVEVSDVAGRVVQTIVNNESYAAGQYKMEWTPTQNGIYFVKVRSNKGEIVQKINVIK